VHMLGQQPSLVLCHDSMTVTIRGQSVKPVTDLHCIAWLLRFECVTFSTCPDQVKHNRTSCVVTLCRSSGQRNFQTRDMWGAQYYCW